jgi:hypothetical protein
MNKNRKFLAATIVGVLILLAGILLWMRPDNQPPIDI